VGRKGQTVACALAAWLFAVAPVSATPLGRVDIGQMAPGFSVMGVDGQAHRLSDYAGKVVILEWMSPACPYTAMKYASGAMQALQRQAAGDHDVWLSINTSAPGSPGYLAVAAARRRLAETHARITSLLFDKDGSVGRAYGARTTPSFFIVGRDGRLAYQGAMDDDPSADDAQGRNYVRAALDDLAAGRPVKDAETRPYGCAVEY
jgi:peroxiredoxin